MFCIFPIFLDICQENNNGEEFIVVFLENGRNQDDLHLFLTSVSNTDTSVTVRTPLWTNPRIQETVTLAVGQVKKFSISTRLSMSGTGKSTKGISIVSPQKIAVFGLNSEQKSCGSFLSLPVDQLGTE